MIGKMRMENKWYYSLSDISDSIVQHAGPFQMELVLPQAPMALDMKQDWISHKSALELLNWCASDVVPNEYLCELGNLMRAIKRDVQAARKFSRKYRWHIAHAQSYRCKCGVLLHPDSFECDHVVEIRDGGSDCWSNLQALCSTCHARKTRSHGRAKDRGERCGQ